MASKMTSNSYSPSNHDVEHYQKEERAEERMTNEVF